ncbi:MAG: hypothetical protein EOO04_18190 [Chitinophagaceae bacterium]|nr:MAG: hypothetical protein EOO04_18190 [Chitinophagaceae bacterium]
MLHIRAHCFAMLILVSVSCNDDIKVPSSATISDLNLKRGQVISCTPGDAIFGKVEFRISCDKTIQNDFNLAVTLLHSFEYDEAEKVFARIIDNQPSCAMAYWGVAMSNFHPLWTPPLEPELIKGAKAMALARQIGGKTKRENDYIMALSEFYNDWKSLTHINRTKKFETAMQKLYVHYPDDQEAAVFYALALNAAADPADKSFANQKKAGTILMDLQSTVPDHPGVVHYLIHSYDSPELAKMGLEAARRYASVAPSSAHALHMPSHIFTRLGLWKECVNSNLASVTAAQCYADSANITGHWDEELHGLDYLVYAYLQEGNNVLAKQQVQYVQTITDVHPQNFKVAYAFAAIPARYILENSLWNEAAQLKSHHETFPWNKYPWQKAIIHFTRLMGAAHTGDLKSADHEHMLLKSIYDTLLGQKDAYKANLVLVQLKSGEAWIELKHGNKTAALRLMEDAADLEDKTEKHPVTPGEVVPARELLGDMLLAVNQPSLALAQYEASLLKHPKRFNGLLGAANAARGSGNSAKTTYYTNQLDSIAGSSDRMALVRKSFGS